jgi:hypothetical protein
MTAKFFYIIEPTVSLDKMFFTSDLKRSQNEFLIHNLGPNGLIITLLSRVISSLRRGNLMFKVGHCAFLLYLEWHFPCLNLWAMCARSLAWITLKVLHSGRLQTVSFLYISFLIVLKRSSLIKGVSTFTPKRLYRVGTKLLWYNVYFFDPLYYLII